jgi:hypothetical protein
MTRELKLLKREIDTLERLHKRLGILLEQKLIASPLSITEALDIIHYQQLILNKLNNCRRQTDTDTYYSPEGFSAHISTLDTVLMERGVAWN